VQSGRMVRVGTAVYPPHVLYYSKLTALAINLENIDKGYLEVSKELWAL